MTHAKPCLLVTGGAGFIGSSYVRQALDKGYDVVVLDALTYAGHTVNLADVWGKITFVEGNILDKALVGALLREHKPAGLIHFAAESHVDNSIASPDAFMHTNIIGTYHLLEAARGYFSELTDKDAFRFVHVSTDEVFGELDEEGYFSETTPYAPNSPYSSSKAASDLLAHAWWHTFKLPVVITHCSNNYGPRQLPEKLIPVMVTNALNEKPLPVYGDGKNVRDWIYVDDHAHGVMLAFEQGRLGEHYCFGGRAEMRNIDLVKTICAYLDRVKPRASGSYADLITFVTDRLGHDRRYAIDDSKAEQELGFARSRKFEQGIESTIDWYLANGEWCKTVMQRG